METRTILAHTLSPKPLTDQQGFIRPLAEIIGDQIVPLDKDNFCPTMKVFIISLYGELEKNFPDQRFFEITIQRSGQRSEHVNPEDACTYVAKGIDVQNAHPLEKKAYFEIIKAQLPDANFRIIPRYNWPGTSYIFVHDNESIFGPFDWEKSGDDEIRLKIIKAPLPGVAEMNDHIFQLARQNLDNEIVATSITGNERFLIRGLALIQHQHTSLYDYANNEEIISYCAKQARNIVGLKSAVDKLKELANSLPSNQNELVQQRFDKLIHIANSINDYNEDACKGMFSYLQSDNGKDIVDRYVEDNKNRYFEKIRAEREQELNSQFEQKLTEINQHEARIKELHQNKSSLNTEIQQLREEEKKLKIDQNEPITNIFYAETGAYLQNANVQLNELNQKISEKQQLVNGLITIETLKKKIDELSERNEREQKQQQALKEATKQLKSQLEAGDTALRKKITELRPFIDAINTPFRADSDTNTRQTLVKSHDTDVRQRDVIAALRQSLSLNGRDLEDWQLANLLISTQQSFITFLAGLPGVGKTSLARLLAEVQNISPRFQEIAVARGWTSQKDLIGFFNPLSNRFQPSNTGMYSFLDALNKEQADTAAMAYILLDEANLSPIEHYWSVFMGMADGEGERELILGQDPLKIPACLRFIATINYDDTTEPLSSRLVDRAPIIVLETQALHDVLVHTEQAVLDLPLSAQRMNDLFGKDKKTPSFEYAEQSVFDSIKQALLDTDTRLGKPISIGMRKELAVRQYCDKARGIMNEDSDYFALDIAVLQHVLPLVRGNGNRFGKRLAKLKDELDSGNLRNSASYVSRMIEFGESDLHTYDFFCW